MATLGRMFHGLPLELKELIWTLRAAPAIIHAKILYVPSFVDDRIEPTYRVEIATQRRYREACLDERRVALRAQEICQSTPNSRLAPQSSPSVTINPTIDILYLKAREYVEIETFFSAYRDLKAQHAAFEYWRDKPEALDANLKLLCLSLPQLTRVFIVCLSVTPDGFSKEIEYCKAKLQGIRESNPMKQPQANDSNGSRRITVDFGERIAARDTRAHILDPSHNYSPDYYQFNPHDG